MKRNLFAELVEGFDVLEREREMKTPEGSARPIAGDLLPRAACANPSTDKGQGVKRGAKGLMQWRDERLAAWLRQWATLH